MMRREPRFLIVSSWLVIAICQTTPAATYYVSPSGDDDHSGTSVETAWRTLDKVNGTDLNPGDKVLLEGGHDYHGNLLLTAEDAGTPMRPVVIGSYGPGRARIKAGDGSGVTVRNAGGVVVENLIVTGTNCRTSVGSGVEFISELPGNQKLQHIRVHNVEAAGFSSGIWVGEWTEDGSKSGCKDVRVTNCVTYQNKREGIVIMGCYPDDPDTYANSDVYIGYCRTYDNPGDPNYLENHSGSGILVAEVDGGVIEYCEAYNNGYACRAYHGPVGIWTWRANNITIQYCESHHNRGGESQDGHGFDFDGGTTNSIMQYNYSHDNDRAGYLLCSHKNHTPHAYNNNIVRYSISANDCQKASAGAICFWSGSPEDAPICDTQIYGNTIYSSAGPAIVFWQQKGICNTKVFNNLFVTANNQRLVQGNPDKSMAIFAGNAYWAVDGKYDIAGYRGLDDWRKAFGQEMLNGKPVGLVVDPEVIDLGKSVTIGDPTNLHTLTAYRLQGRSPLVDAGLDPRSLFGLDVGRRDFYRNPIPQGKAFDIGAHETVAENPSRAEQK